MGYRVSATDPEWFFDETEWEKQAATFLKGQSITTDAGRATFVAGASSALLDAITKAFLNCIKVRV